MTLLFTIVSTPLGAGINATAFDLDLACLEMMMQKNTKDMI